MNATLGEHVSLAVNGVREAARKYGEAGVAVCRIRPGEKRPTHSGWSTRSADPESFGPGDGIGLVCGWPSDGRKEGQFLVCVDLDSRDAIDKADDYLPGTGAIEGRDGKRRSHWWYLVTDVPPEATSKADQAAKAAINAEKHPGPAKRAFKHAETKKTLVDFLGSGSQAVVPPSVHEESGEVRRWEPGCSIDQATTVPFAELWKAVCKLAAACGWVEKSKGRKPRTEKTKKVNKVDTPVAKAATPAGQVQGTCTRECDVPMAERVVRCRWYLRETDLAKSGQGGHDMTYRIARLIVNCFAVTDRERALELMRSYNTRLRLNHEEVWTESDMARKIDSALDAADDPDYPFGGKLMREEPDPREWDDPARLAEGFLNEQTVRFVKGTPFVYADGAYRVVSGEWLSARVRGFIQRAATAECGRKIGTRKAERERHQATLHSPPPAAGALTEAHALHAVGLKAAEEALRKLDQTPPPTPAKVSQAMVANTIGALAVPGQLPDDTQLDSWLGGRACPAVLAVANGLLDPVGRTLLDHTAEWFSTAKLAVPYDPNAPAPAKWLAVLGELLQGDADRIAVVQELFGACLDRGLNAKFIGAFVGSGDNGKSVVQVVLRSLLGDANCSSVNLDELTTNRFAAFSLFGKLANLIGDQGHFESADEGRVKTLTGGDLVTFEQKGKDPFTAVNRAKLIFGCNTMPTFADKSEAVWNRLVAVPFEYTVPAAKKNPALLTPEYWADELAGVLNWALDGLARLRSQGRFTASAKCEALKGQTRLDSNPARLFLGERCEHTGAETDKVTVDELYRAYKSWCDAGGFTRPLTKQKFGREVRAAHPGLGGGRNVRVGESTPRCWVGLRLKPLDETPV